MDVIDYISRCRSSSLLCLSVAALCSCLLGSSSCIAQTNDKLAELLHAGADSLRSGQSAEALKYFTEASAMAPQVAEIKLDIALALRGEEKYPEEILELQSALKLNPSLRGANLFLGVAYYKLDEYAKAREALKRELKLNATRRIRPDVVRRGGFGGE